MTAHAIASSPCALRLGVWTRGRGWSGRWLGAATFLVQAPTATTTARWQGSAEIPAGGLWSLIRLPSLGAVTVGHRRDTPACVRHSKVGTRVESSAARFHRGWYAMALRRDGPAARACAELPSEDWPTDVEKATDDSAKPGLRAVIRRTSQPDARDRDPRASGCKAPITRRALFVPA
jgi:hypothetical protein